MTPEIWGLDMAFLLAGGSPMRTGLDGVVEVPIRFDPETITFPRPAECVILRSRPHDPEPARSRGRNPVSFRDIRPHSGQLTHGRARHCRGRWRLGLESPHRHRGWTPYRGFYRAEECHQVTPARTPRMGTSAPSMPPWWPSSGSALGFHRCLPESPGGRRLFTSRVNIYNAFLRILRRVVSYTSCGTESL